MYEPLPTVNTGATPSTTNTAGLRARGVTARTSALVRARSRVTSAAASEPVPSSCRS